ncbi:hypothetical protein BC940DRAFT_338189 [Gongronella butleri]|nr:hypothetical protein BC940DRAFT_338189 [Gongronella butleri]
MGDMQFCVNVPFLSFGEYVEQRPSFVLICSLEATVFLIATCCYIALLFASDDQDQPSGYEPYSPVLTTDRVAIHEQAPMDELDMAKAHSSMALADSEPLHDQEQAWHHEDHPSSLLLRRRKARQRSNTLSPCMRIVTSSKFTVKPNQSKQKPSVAPQEQELKPLVSLVPSPSTSTLSTTSTVVSNTTVACDDKVENKKINEINENDDNDAETMLTAPVSPAESLVVAFSMEASQQKPLPPMSPVTPVVKTIKAVKPCVASPIVRVAPPALSPSVSDSTLSSIDDALSPLPRRRNAASRVGLLIRKFEAELLNAMATATASNRPVERRAFEFQPTFFTWENRSSTTSPGHTNYVTSKALMSPKKSHSSPTRIPTQ